MSSRALFLGVALIVVLFALLNSQTTGQVPQAAVIGGAWEYKVNRGAVSDSNYNSDGNQGWELVTLVREDPNAGLIAVFKRMKK